MRDVNLQNLRDLRSKGTFARLKLIFMTFKSLIHHVYDVYASHYKQFNC